MGENSICVKAMSATLKGIAYFQIGNKAAALTCASRVWPQDGYPVRITFNGYLGTFAIVFSRVDGDACLAAWALAGLCSQ